MSDEARTGLSRTFVCTQGHKFSVSSEAVQDAKEEWNLPLVAKCSKCGSNTIELQNRVSSWAGQAPTGLHDAMLGYERMCVPVHKHGFVALVDVMPRMVPVGRGIDYAVVQAARVSTGQGLKSPEDDEGLIRYLMRHRHSTPFEMVELKFHVSLPIFLARQWIRHRTASVNEVSARYTELPDQYYLPGQWRKQGTNNKQGGEEPMEYSPSLYGIEALEGEYTGDCPTNGADSPTPAGTVVKGYAEDVALREYHRQLKAGVSRELARSCLPVSIYTQWYWKCDLHNILGFLSLRMHGHAQQEIRDYADAMYDILCLLCPVTMRAFRDFRFEAMQISRLEVAALRAEIMALRSERDAYQQVVRGYEAECGRSTSPFTAAHFTRPELASKREQSEWQSKRLRLGLTSEPVSPS